MLIYQQSTLFCGCCTNKQQYYMFFINNLILTHGNLHGQRGNLDVCENNVVAHTQGFYLFYL